MKAVDQGTLQKEQERGDVCQPCITFSDGGEDCTIRITLDGSMRHARLKIPTGWDFEIFEPTCWVDEGRKMIDLARSANQRVNTIIPSNAFRHIFKATDTWNRPEIITTLKKALDTSGVVSIICFQRLNLRLLNIYSGGEQQSHSIRLMNAVLYEVPHFAEPKLSYDIGCVCESAMYH